MKISTGYALFVAPPYRVELSLNLLLVSLVAGFVALYILLRIVRRAMGLPEEVRSARRRTQQERARAKQDAAVVALLEGRYGRARQFADEALAIPQSSGLAALVGARAAIETRDFDGGRGAARASRRAGRRARGAAADARGRDQARAAAAGRGARRAAGAAQGGGAAHGGAAARAARAAGAPAARPRFRRSSTSWSSARSTAPRRATRRARPRTREALAAPPARCAGPARVLEPALRCASSGSRRSRAPRRGSFLALGGDREAVEIARAGASSATGSPSLLALYAECRPEDRRGSSSRPSAGCSEHSQDATLLHALGAPVRAGSSCGARRRRTSRRAWRSTTVAAHARRAGRAARASSAATTRRTRTSPRRSSSPLADLKDAGG